MKIFVASLPFRHSECYCCSVLEGCQDSKKSDLEDFGCHLRACLHGGGGPQVGEVTRLAVVEKWPAFTCKLTTRGPGVTLLDVVA